MTRKCIISAVVMFVMAWGLSFVVHGLLLAADYQDTPGMRPPAQAQQIIYFLILAQAIFGAAFAWVYMQGKDDKPWFCWFNTTAIHIFSRPQKQYVQQAVDEGRAEEDVVRAKQFGPLNETLMDERLAAIGMNR